MGTYPRYPYLQRYRVLYAIKNNNDEAVPQSGHSTEMVLRNRLFRVGKLDYLRTNAVFLKTPNNMHSGIGTDPELASRNFANKTRVF